MSEERFYIKDGVIHDRQIGDVVSAFVVCKVLNRMNVDLQKTLDMLHDVGGNYFAREAVKRPMTEPLRKSIERKIMTDEEIEKQCLDLWEEVAMRNAKRMP